MGHFATGVPTTIGALTECATPRKRSRLFLLLTDLFLFLLDSLFDGLLPTRCSDSVEPGLVQQIFPLSCT